MFARQRKTHVPFKRDLKQLLASDTSLNVTVLADANAAFHPSLRNFVTGNMDLCMLVLGYSQPTRGYLLHRNFVCARGTVGLPP